MADRSSRLRLGLFTAVSLAALTGVVVLFGGSQSMFTSRTKYTIVFPEAPGLSVGTPVRKSGVRIGQVTALDLDDVTGRVRVSVALDPKYPLRKSDDATISRGLLSGDTTLDFVPKNELAVSTTTPELYEPNAEITGVAPISARTLLKGASDVIPNAQDNIAKVVNSIQRFEQAVPKIERAIEEIALLARSGREFVPELRQTNIKVQNLLGLADPDDKDEPASLKVIFKQLIAVLQAIQPAAEEIRNLVKANGPEIGKTIVAVRQSAEGVNEVLNPENRKAISGTLKNVQTGTDDLVRTIRIAALFLDTAEKTVKDINARIAQAEKVIDNVDKATKPFADNSAQLATGLAETLRNLNGASDQLTKALGEIRTTVNTVNRGEGTVGKAINDPTLYNNLNETTANVARLMMRLDKISRDLEVFADKIARKPETIGLGGVVRPNTGLKESPNAPLPPSPLLPIAPAQPTAPMVLPLAPGMPQSGPLTPIAPVPFGPTGTPPQTVYKPELPKQ